MIDIYSRYQKNFNLYELYPSIKGKCACGCGKPLTGRRTRWATNNCVNIPLAKYSIIKGDVSVIREELYKRDKGKCSRCNKYTDYWEADHILAVKDGGGGCNLDNFQTLCYVCHKKKTKQDR